jgi:hypothetical protein
MARPKVTGWVAPAASDVTHTSHVNFTQRPGKVRLPHRTSRRVRGIGVSPIAFTYGSSKR